MSAKHKWKRGSFSTKQVDKSKSDVTVEGYVLDGKIGIDRRDDWWWATELASGYWIANDDKKAPLQRLIERYLDVLGGDMAKSEDEKFAALQEARYGN